MEQNCFLMGFLGVGAGNIFFSQFELAGFFSQLEPVEGVDIILPSPIKEEEKEDQEKASYLSYEQAVTSAVEKVSPSVVSIVVTKDIPIMEEYYYYPFEGFDIRVPRYRQEGTEEQEVGGGTGFIVSSNGLVLTNKHVVKDKEADYTVFTNSGEKYEAEVLARDPFQDIAVLKIEAENLPVVRLGDSDEIKIGQTTIAIGNVLGEFRNSVSVGVVSGLSRDVTASGGGSTEMLEDIVQTDAAINRGNSGGPLLNIEGEVIGINTAMAVSAENVGFAIPINQAKRDIEQVRETGEIIYPFLGIYYTMISPTLAEEYGLSVQDGAWVGRNQLGEKTERAIFPDSPAEEVGLRRDDIIVRFDKKDLTLEDDLADVIRGYSPGDRVALRVLRGGEEVALEVELDRLEQ